MKNFILLLTLSSFASCISSYGVNDRFCATSTNSGQIGNELRIIDKIGDEISIKINGIMTDPAMQQLVNERYTAREKVSKERLTSMLHELKFDKDQCHVIDEELAKIHKKEQELLETLKVTQKSNEEKTRNEKLKVDQDLQTKKDSDKKYFFDNVIKDNVFCVQEFYGYGDTIKNYKITSSVENKYQKGKYQVELIKGCIDQKSNEFTKSTKEPSTEYVDPNSWSRKLGSENVNAEDNKEITNPSQYDGSNTHKMIFWGRENCFNITKKLIKEAKDIRRPKIGQYICKSDAVSLDETYRVTGIWDLDCIEGSQKLSFRIIAKDKKSDSETYIDLTREKNEQDMKIYSFDNEYCMKKIKDIQKSTSNKSKF